MKRIVYSIIVLLAMVVSSFTAEAQMPVSLGVRAGANISSQNINAEELYEGVCENNTTWKAGFLVGLVADIKFSNRFAVQPGLFWKRHAYDYFNASVMNDGSRMRISSGEAGYYTFQIPVLASYRINVSVLEWQIDLGPYVAFGAGGNNKLETTEISLGEDGQSIRSYRYKSDFNGESDGKIVGCGSFDWGLKFGTGFKILGKYYVGIHYNAGMKNLGKKHEGFKGKPSVSNKSVDFSVGYNF